MLFAGENRFAAGSSMFDKEAGKSAVLICALWLEESPNGSFWIHPNNWLSQYRNRAGSQNFGYAEKLFSDALSGLIEVSA